MGSTLLGLLWLVTTAAGWRAVRAHRYAAHRAWMLRSMALTFSIVLNRIWLGLLAVVVTLVPGAVGSPDAVVPAIAGASVWLSWIVNLLVVEWWLLRRPQERREPAQRSSADAVA